MSTSVIASCGNFLRYCVRLDRANGNRLIVGSTRLPNGTSAAYVYRRDPPGLDWTLEGTLSPPASDGDQSYFSEHVDVEGNFAAVSSDSGGITGQGAVYVYTRSAAGVWSFAAALSSPLNGSRAFGSDLAISASRLLVAAKRVSFSAATADYFLYTLSDLAAPPTTLPPLGPLSGAHMFLRAVAITPTHAFAAYPSLSTPSPASLVFVYDLLDPNRNHTVSASGIRLFSSLAASDNFLAGGSAFGELPVQVYRLDGATQKFVSDGTVVNPEPNPTSQFGVSLGITDERLVVGVSGGTGLEEVRYLRCPTDSEACAHCDADKRRCVLIHTHCERVHRSV